MKFKNPFIIIALVVFFSGALAFLPVGSGMSHAGPLGSGETSHCEMFTECTIGDCAGGQAMFASGCSLYCDTYSITQYVFCQEGF
jgi:hypothetical protein